jgi:hypothetical protein
MIAAPALAAVSMLALLPYVETEKAARALA